MTGNPPLPSVSEPIWSAVPESLASRQQWLLWRFEFKPGSDKPGKIPYYVMGGRRTGNQGSDQDRQRLSTLAVVRKAYERGSWHGVGFAFLPDDGLIGIDIDGAIDPESGEPNDRCRNIIERCASYTERSPSGQGVHILVEGTTNTNKSNDIGLEVFCGSQFFTFTADRWPETPAEVRPIDESVLRRLHVTIDDAKAQAKAAKQAAARPSSAPPSAAQPVGGGGDDFARTNATAMMALHAWVPSLFPGAIARGDGYRVTSKALGRNLQEDLSIDPKGIVDFGVADMGDARDGKRSPIDLVMEWLPGTSTAAEALRWLAKQLGVELTPPQRPQKPPRANDPAPAGGGQGGGGKGRPPQGDGGDEPPMGPEDVAALLMQNRGKPIDCRENVLYCFEHDPALQGLVKMNEFTGLLERSRETPWGAEPGEWDEEDDLMLGEYLARVYRLIVKATSTLRNGVLMASRKCKFNPVIDTIKTEAWDGIQRLESWLSDIYEVEDRPYTRLIGRCFMMGLVKRAIQPGCKFDYMLIIKGEQGLSKSSAFRELAYPYFTDNAIRVGDKDSLMAMQLAWIVESAELESLNKSETTLIKQFLSAQEDLYRPPYGSQMVRKPRHSVNVGTTNADTFLKDSTGDRRFWPLEVFHVNLDVLKSIKHQLLAEALHRVEAGEQYWPTRQEEKDLIFPEQERFKRADPWEDLLDAYVNAQFGEQQTDIPRCDRDFFTTIEIYDKALNIKADRIDGAGQMDTRIGNAMRSLGFERHRESSGRRARGFRRLPPPAAPAQPPAPVSGPAGPVEEGHDLPF